jgi:hypothetical protein
MKKVIDMKTIILSGYRKVEAPLAKVMIVMEVAKRQVMHQTRSHVSAKSLFSFEKRMSDSHF